VIQRRKQGFQAPMRDWYGPLFARHGRLLEGGALVDLGVLRPEAASAFAKGAYPWSESVPRAYSALVLEAWCRQAMGAD